MYTLKRMAIRENRKRSRKARRFAQEFVGVVNRYGRSRETELMVRYMLATNPLGAVSAASLLLWLTILFLGVWVTVAA